MVIQAARWRRGSSSHRYFLAGGHLHAAGARRRSSLMTSLSLTQRGGTECATMPASVFLCGHLPTTQDAPTGTHARLETRALTHGSQHTT